jgi:hypothetical protein
VLGIEPGRLVGIAHQVLTDSMQLVHYIRCLVIQEHKRRRFSFIHSITCVFWA